MHKPCNSKGFTLVEMAIVLVIIGVILGAVVKGQDLINNAQAKQVISAASSWRNLAYAFMDRNGRMPGDQSRDGIIGNVAATETGGTLTSINELLNSMQNVPNNPITVGSLSFYMYTGFVTPTAGNLRNALIICKDANCTTAFTTDELEIIKSIDTALDGTADAGMGQLRAVTAAPTITAATTTLGRNNGTVIAATISGTGTPIVGTTAPWATTQFAAIWLFDRPFP